MTDLTYYKAPRYKPSSLVAETRKSHAHALSQEYPEGKELICPFGILFLTFFLKAFLFFFLTTMHS